MTDRPTPSAAPDPSLHRAPPVTGSGEGTDHPADATSGPAPVPPPSPARYELGDEIARGGMGVVYRATDTALGREVAVKVLSDKFTPTSTAARRFLDEARITGGLQHPGVPPVHDLGALPDGRPFLAMKLVKGRTLDDLLKDRPDPSHDRGRFVAAFEAVCQAVGFAHAHGVVHRDLKPANVMVGSFGEVQVMDWGLAKVLADHSEYDPEADDDSTAAGTEIRSVRGADDATKAGVLLGTPAYLPPEQAMGAVDQIDERSDVFGLGAVLCAILTGKPPYVGADRESTRQLAVRAKLDDALTRLDGCGADPELVALCRRCLSPEKADRPADGEAVAKEVAALRAAADDRARQAEADRLRAEGDLKAAEVKTAEGRKRRRILALAAAAVMLALGIGAVVSYAKYRDAEDARATADKERGIAEGERETAKAEAAAKDDARRKALTALQRVTDQWVWERAGRQVEVTDRDRAFFRDVLRLWEEFAAVHGSEREAEVIRAMGAFRVGRIRAALGEWSEAEAAYRTAAAGWERLAAAHPADSEYPRELSGTLNNLANILGETGRPTEAEATHRAAVTVGERLAVAHPADPAGRDRLAAAHTSLGVHLRSTGRVTEAEAAYRAAAAEFAAISAAHQGVPGYLAGFAAAQLNLGNLYREADRVTEAEAAYRLAVAAFDRLCVAHPNAPDYQSGLASVQSNLGKLLRATGRPGEAEVAYRAAVAVSEQLAAAHPAIPDYRHRLALSHLRLGDHFRAAGRLADAEASYRIALTLLERLAPAHPTVRDYRVDLAATVGHLCEVLRATGRAAEVEATCRPTLTFIERLTAVDPADAGARHELAKDMYSLGNLLRDVDRPADAERAYREAIRLAPQYHPPRINLGKMFYDRGDLVRSAAVYREAALALPNNPLVRENLAGVERDAALAGRLAAIRTGAARPASPAEGVALAEQASRSYRRQYDLAVWLCIEAFAADPKLAAENRYNATCAALLAASANDPASPIGWDEWGILQDLAFSWLTAELSRARRLAAATDPATRQRAARILGRWRAEAALASVRDHSQRAWMPADDRERWAKFWAEVDATLATTRPAVAPPPREAK